MGYLRFYRRKQIAPGVRLNLSKSGPSISVGRRGAWYTVGPRGRRTTVGIPGTGVYYTQQHRHPRAVRRGHVAVGNGSTTVPALLVLPFALLSVLFWLCAWLVMETVHAGVATAIASRHWLDQRRGTR